MNEVSYGICQQCLINHKGVQYSLIGYGGGHILNTRSAPVDPTSLVAVVNLKLKAANLSSIFCRILL